MNSSNKTQKTTLPPAKKPIISNKAPLTIKKTDKTEKFPLKNTDKNVEKTVKKPFISSEKKTPFDESTQKLLILDEKTTKFRNKPEKTQVLQLFQPQINVFSPLNPDFHTITQKTCQISQKTLIKSSEIADFPDKNQWRIEDILLGKGAFGNVYRVFDKKTSDFFAVKIIEIDENREEFSDIYEKTLFEVFLMKEANKLNSLNIVKFVDVFVKKSKGDFSNEIANSCDLLIVLQLCECSLQDLIEIRKEIAIKWQENELLFYFQALLSVLFGLETLKISHRDIKPRNILYNLSEKSMKIADFGEGKISSFKPKSDNLSVNLKENSHDLMMNTVRGTPVYMSPEVYNSYRNHCYSCVYDPLSSDIYSLGLTFFVMKRLDSSLKRDFPEGKSDNSMKENGVITERLINAMLEENPEKRLVKTIEIFEKEIKPLKNSLKIPDETHVLQLFTMKKEGDLKESEKIQKKMMIANVQKNRKLSRSEGNPSGFVEKLGFSKGSFNKMFYYP